MMFGNIDVFGFLWGVLSRLLQPIVDFMLSFLPDGDPAVYAVIDSVGDVGGSMTFNVFYFCDWAAVLICIGVFLTVMLVVQVVKLIMRALDIGSKAIEAIPVVE